MNYNCQIFTPEKHVEKMLDSIQYNGTSILGKYILENSCGEGNFLIKIIKRYIEAAKESEYSNQRIKGDLETFILGFEIDSRIRDICIQKLNATALTYGISDVNWNIKNKDYLKYSIDRKVDYLVGNPPYIMYQNLRIEERQFLRKNFLSCYKGKFDYCYAFIEKSLNDLNVNGKMSYIVPNSIFKNVFGKELRNIMKSKLKEIYDYKESVVFENILISPAIICLSNKKEKEYIKYHDVDNKKEYLIDKKILRDKWLFSLDEANINLKGANSFGDYFKVSNSVATLRNSIFIIDKRDVLNENDEHIELKDFLIEKSVLRPAASPRSRSINRKEYIIFPYKYIDGQLKRYEEVEFKMKYPGAYKYLLSFKTELNERKSDKSAKWFEYGRSQALAHLNQEKILISSLVTKGVKLYRIDKSTIPYSGFYIIPIANKSLDEAIEILQTEKFFSYLIIRGINASGKSLRFSVNDILNYPLN